MINRREFQLACVVGLSQAIRTSHASARVADAEQPTTTWPQWGGPQRDFSVPQLGRSAAAAPQLVWQRDLGKGHAAIVSDGEFAYSLRLDGDNEVLEKWRTDNGDPLWSKPTSIDFHASIEEYDGPHATPVLLEDRIVTVGIDAAVRAFDLSAGELLWTRDLRSDYGTILPQSGYAASPLVWQGRLILPTLGNARADETERYEPNTRGIPGAAAIDIQTGAELWRSASFRSSHASPILIDVAGQPTVVFHGMFELVGIDPQDGSILWRQMLRREAADNVTFTPIWDAARSQLLVSHGYCDFGTQAIELDKRGGDWNTEINWTNSRLRIVHTNAVLSGTTLLGTGRSTVLVAINVQDGGTVFRQRGFGKSNFLKIGSQLLVLDESGDLVGGELRTEKLEEAWRTRVLTANSWTVPSIAGGWLLLRDLRQLKAYRLLTT